MAQTNPRTLTAASPTAAPAASTTQTVSGRVVSATTGLPVFRALVRLNDRAVLSDHEGRFEFPQFGATPMNDLQVTKPGFYASSDPMEPGAVLLRTDQLSQPIEIRLYPEALLTGTVTRPDGTPLPQIPITAKRSVYNDQNHRWVQVGQGNTDSHGNFRLPVPPGEYKLETGYSARNGTTSEAVLPLIIPGDSERNRSSLIHVASGALEHFDLHPALSRTYAVTVAIDSPAERGFPMITARSSNGLTIPGFSSGRSTDPGVMRLELPAGTYTLTATQTNQDVTRYGEATVTITDHDVDKVVLRLADVSPIAVELVVDSDATSDKTPPTVQQLGLTLEATADSAQPEGTMLGVMTTLGTPSFHAMPGTYHLQARGNGVWYVRSAYYGTTDLLNKDLTVSAGASGDTIRLTISNQTGSLKGTTTLNGMPTACWLYLVPTGPSATGVFSSRSNSDGNYNFTSLPPGSYKGIAFEQRHSFNYRDPGALERFSTYAGTVTINAGNKASLDLNAVPVKEMNP
jgi:hypothetical protein